MTERALEASGEDYNVYVPCMNSLSSLGEIESANKLRQRMITAPEQQIDLVPEDVRARILLATHYAYFGNKVEAVQPLEKACCDAPERPEHALQRCVQVWASRDEK